MEPGDESLLRERFAALAGPAEGEWTDVRRRVRKRGRRLAVLVAAVAVALVATGFGVGGDVIGLFAEHGKTVPLSSFTERDRTLLVESMCPSPAISQDSPPRVVCRSGEPTVEEIANDGVEIHWRVRYPWGLTCVASGPVGGRHDEAFGDSKIVNLGCNAGAPGYKVVPTPKRPITVDAAMGTSVGHPHVRLFRVSGLAGQGIASVGLIAQTGPPLKTRVRGRAYSFSSIPDRRWVAIAAYDALGSERYRERLEGVGALAPRVTAPPPKSEVWAPGPPARPSGAPLQHTATPDAVVDVYRNGIVELRFTSTASEAYRRLVHTSRYSSGVAGIDCFNVGFGRGRWQTIGGGANARVAPAMGMRPNVGAARAGFPTPPFDGCEVSGTYGRYWNDEEGTHELVEAPFDAIGRRYFDERATARDLAYLVRSKKMHAIRLAIHRGEPAPSAEELVRIFGSRVVPLASRIGTAANGKVGVWSDRKLIVASELTPGGRRLYVTIDALRIGPNDIRDLSFVY